MPLAIKKQESEFADRVRAVIERVGGSAELAKRTGLSRQMVDRYAGGSEPTRESLVALARAGGVSLEWLAAGSGTPTSVSATSVALNDSPPLEAQRDEGFAVRLERIASRAGGWNELARKSRISRETLDSYQRGAEPEDDSIKALAGAGGVRILWLRTGEGPMDSSLAVQELAPPKEGYIALPRYDVNASAGVGLPVVSEDLVDFVYFKAEWLRRTLGVSPHQLALIEAVGDSMAPGIEDGDLLMVDLGQPRLRGDGVYVLAMDDERIGLMVKRLEMTPQGGLVITSDNQRAGYGRYAIAPGELASVRIVGRVVWAGGRL